MARDVIICFIGKSGAGKTTIAKELEDRYNIIKSFTTRPPRTAGEWGHTFVSKEFMIPYHELIAFTNYKGHKYWATQNQFKNKGISIYIIDREGIKYLKRKMPKAKIVIVYIKCGFLKRAWRLLKRDKLKCIGRLWHDHKAFKNITYDYVIDCNNNKYDAAIQVESLITRKFWGLNNV